MCSCTRPHSLWTPSKMLNSFNSNHNKFNSKITNKKIKNEPPSPEQQEYPEERHHKEVRQSPSSSAGMLQQVHCLLVRNDVGKQASVVTVTVMISDHRCHPRAKCRGAVRSWTVNQWAIEITLLPARQVQIVRLTTCRRVPSHVCLTPERLCLEGSLQPMSLSLSRDNTPLLQLRHRTTCLKRRDTTPSTVAVSYSGWW